MRINEKSKNQMTNFLKKSEKELT